MRLFVSVAAIALLVAGSVSAKDPESRCPADIDLSSSAWVLREIRWMNGGVRHADYLSSHRIFAYQDDPQKRLKKEFHPTSWGETYSFKVGGHETVIAKRIVSIAGERSLLLQSSGEWIEGSRIGVTEEFNDRLDPAYFVFLFGGEGVSLIEKSLFPSSFRIPRPRIDKYTMCRFPRLFFRTKTWYTFCTNVHDFASYRNNTFERRKICRY